MHFKSIPLELIFYFPPVFIFCFISANERSDCIKCEEIIQEVEFLTEDNMKRHTVQNTTSHTAEMGHTHTHTVHATPQDYTAAHIHSV